ncbi:restriction endonuclease FokI C-terminal domain-containing protein [Lacticaseibacillus sharpeae]|uniref:FokIR protein n=1 Tax=Lacticaseibacillus sharpeae JCM 1186 = DSM 20505 TaxID=1291052 RepID=A0A0R1ZT34_9LACO|nr:restriction endonuclease FokI C-terminal domain-containing protein [Lacticaseibacillus sharpeae]KRM54886.1 fokIR protein [Lacticaseibacillus sharpeae JCM 1186 = DSM 20505]
MAITINYYPKNVKRFSTGLGQDVGSLRSMIDMLQVFIIDSPIQNKVKEKMNWQFGDNPELKETILSKLSTTPVQLTTDELASEYPKKTGIPATWKIKSVLPAIMDGQSIAKNEDGSTPTNPDGDTFKTPMRAWPIRNFFSSAIGLGLLNWNRINGNISITTLGEQLATASHSESEELTNEELTILQLSFMSYPYAVAFLKSLEDSKEGLNKFQLGESFGFAGEAGFTSFGEELYVSALTEAYEDGDRARIKKIKSNWESTSDKYIRGIASLLSKLKLISIVDQLYSYESPKTGRTSHFSLPAYKLTGYGRENLGIALGRSKHKRTTKNVTWDMLATKGNVVYTRTVRALILMELDNSSGLTADQIATRINENKVNKMPIFEGATVTPEEISDHINGLNGIGIQIDKNANNKYVLKDPIQDFEIPITASELPKKDNVQRQQDELRPLLKHVDHRYLQLVELALDSSQNSEYSMLESMTMELLLTHLDFDGASLGGASKPDGIAWDKDGNFLIVDTKAYDNGYSLAGNTDKVARYIDDVRAKDPNRASTWWTQVPESLNVDDNLSFMYVSGSFTGNYQRLLKDLRARTNARGGLTTVEKLLLTSEAYLAKSGYGHTQLLNDWTDDNIDHSEYYDKIVNQI